MKKLLFLFLAFFTVASCDKDANCNSDSLSSTIVGTWIISKGNIHLGTMEFLADGTFIDNGSIFGFGLLDGDLLPNKMYTITGTEMMTIKFSKNGSPSMLNYNYHAASFSCEQIVLDNGSELFTLNR